MAPVIQAVVDAVAGFFAKHEVASLELPTGWFGRPYDNLHHLTEAVPFGNHVMIRLDGTQVLTVEATGTRVEGRVLRIEIRGGTWVWTEYGGSRTHTDALGAGAVQFHAPWARS